MTKRFFIPIVVLLLVVLSLQGAKYGLQYAAPHILPPVAQPITMAAVIYESEVDDALAHYDQHQAMMGVTARELRKVNKWRQYDKNEVPERCTDLLELARQGQPQGQKTWEPWLGLYHETELNWNGSMPENDAGLKQTIQENGGL